MLVKNTTKTKKQTTRKEYASEANCEKTTLLSQLYSVFKTFSNPAAITLAWLDAEIVGVIFLNDFR